jgi:hypothetical protein
MKFGTAIKGDLDAIIFNPVASIILKLRFKVLGVPCSTVGLDWLCIMATNLLTVGNNGNQVGLDYL